MDQQALLADITKQTGIHYEVPNILDASVCIFMHYISTHEHLISMHNGTWIFTNCQGKNQDHRVAIGGFVTASLNVFNHHLDHRYPYVGVAPIRNLISGSRK